MRKLISIATFITLVVHTNSQSFQQHYGFPPQIQTPSVGVYTSESSLYLPPETQTTIPYFPLKSTNNLQYLYLPPTGTKAPAVYPSPFPFPMSSIVPNFEEIEEDDDDNDDKIRLSTPYPQNMFKFPNTTQNNLSSEKKETRSLPKSVMYNHPIDRIDIKFPIKFGPTQPPQMNMQTPSNRRMIISPENVKSEPLMGDQLKAASYHGVQYIQPPSGLIGSTTEPAIPILRLSNEMDLDGSYSYEALGADQTHYVQHSRMENMGTDKEEQVVEGSYSYVGDNGQTYTVHYVADANGFRASGDHLPVGPPVPEIIQRSIQYNLAEEAKRPAHLQGWHEEERNNEIDGSTRVQRLALPPQRNLFTGRTPEAFAYNFGKIPQNNNKLATAPSTPMPITAHLERPKEQSKPSNGPIAPQITFLASQGAHVPSIALSSPQPQPIARIFNTNSDKAPMPKLMNYELTTVENDHESSKPLWRWQYGLNAKSAKNLISRSSGFNEDEVTLNFNEMTPEQYKFMIHSQFDTNANDNEKYDIPGTTISNDQVELSQNHKEIESKEYPTVSSTAQPVTEYHYQPKNMQTQEQPRPTVNRYLNSWYNEPNNDIHSQLMQHQASNQNLPRELDYPSKTPKLITRNDFIPPSQTVTQSYDYDESYYEPRKVRTQKSNVATFVQSKAVESENNIERPRNEPTNDPLRNHDLNKEREDSSNVNPSGEPEYIIPETNEKFKQWVPLTPFIETDTKQNHTSTTTESIMQDMLKNNIFLKNLINPKENTKSEENKLVNDNSSTEKVNKVNEKNIEEKSSKSFPLNNHKMTPNHDIKFMRKQPMDMSDVIHYMATKNHFESSKIRPKSPESHFPHTKLNEEGPIYYKTEIKEYVQEKPNAVVKKYKTLQRNNLSLDQGNAELRRDLTPPPQDHKNLHNLPPLGRAGPTIKSYLPPIFV